MREIIPHVEKFLQHQNLLSEFSKGLLKSKLGSIYYFTNMANSQLMLADSLKTLEKENFGNLSAEDRSKVARSFLHIGAIYTELRLEKEAQEIIEKAIGIYQRESERNNIELSWALSHIGNVHRRLGNYEKARNSLEESVRLHKLYGVDNKRLARTLAYLGSTYRGLGFYQKSIDSLKESLALYNHTYSKDHFRIGWTLTQLGNVYRRVGDPQKAKTCFEESVLIFENYLPQDHINMAVSLAYLGNCYGELGDHEKARKYLEESLKIHQKHFDENHRRMGWILFHLASAYKATGQYGKAQKLFDRVLKIYANHYQEENIETAHLLRDVAGIFLEKNSFDNAESYIKRSLKILQARNHVDAYRSLEVLGDIYLKKSIHPSYQKNEQGREDLKNLAIDKFSQALKIIEQHFPKNSIYMKKINFKIKKAQE